MKAQVVSTFGTRQCGVVKAKGLTLYVSYGTVIGIGHGQSVFLTAKKYSPTTSRQVRECLLPAMRTKAQVVTTLGHGDFLCLAKDLGLQVRQHRSDRGAVTQDVNSPINLQH